MATRRKFFADLQKKLEAAASEGDNKETSPASNTRQLTKTLGTSNIRATKPKAPSACTLSNIHATKPKASSNCTVTQAKTSNLQRIPSLKRQAPSLKHVAEEKENSGNLGSATTTKKPLANITPTKAEADDQSTTSSPAPSIGKADQDLFNQFLNSINFAKQDEEQNSDLETGISFIENKADNPAKSPTRNVDLDPEVTQNTTSVPSAAKTNGEDSSVSKSKSFDAPTATKETAASPTHSSKKVELNDGSASNDARESNDISAKVKDVNPANINVLLIVSETNDKNESSSGNNAKDSNDISSAENKGRGQLFEDLSFNHLSSKHNSESKNNQEILHKNSTTIHSSNDSGVSLDDNISPLNYAPKFGGPNQVKRKLFQKSDTVTSDETQLVEIEADEHKHLTSFFEDLPEGVTDLEVEAIDVVHDETLGADKLDSSDQAILLSGNSPGPLLEDENADFSVTVSLTDSSFDPSSTSTAKKKRTRSYNPPEKKTRKRVSNPKRWKKNRNKEKLDKGEQYLTFKGKVMRGKALQEPCDECCRLKCTRVSEEDRMKVFETYWKKVPSKQAKWFFVHSLTEPFEKKSATTDNSRRAKSRKYFLPVNGGRVQVCKVMFLATLDISDGQVTTATKKGKGSPDKRGKTPRSITNKINPALKDSVREHINSLPRMPSHYVRQESEKEYLTGDVASLAELHEIYLQWMKFHSPNIQEVATYRQYSDIFNTEFNISFFIPKKDQCDFCIEYENSSEADQEPLKEKYDEHITNKTLVQDMRLADNEVAKKTKEKSLAVFCFDYEQTLICPRARASSFHFKRKLSVNNFTVARVGKVNEDVCYVYNETIASKGSNEVASFLWHFMKTKVEEGVTEFRMYSDNCWGQNKNRGVMSFLATFVQRFKDRDISIVLRYLEKGHSYNSADTVHNMIERKTKNRDIYAPEEWYHFIETAKRSKTHPIKVIRVQQDMVFDWVELAAKLNFDKDTEGRPVGISKIREIRVETALPLQIQFRYDLADSTSRTLSLRKVGKPVNLATYELKKAYSGPLSISKLKQADLKYYCDHNLIPLKYHELFRNLPVCTAAPQDKDDDTIILPGPGRERKRRARQAPKGRKKKSRMESEEENEEDVDDLTF